MEYLYTQMKERMPKQWVEQYHLRVDTSPTETETANLANWAWNPCSSLWRNCSRTGELTSSTASKTCRGPRSTPRCPRSTRRGDLSPPKARKRSNPDRVERRWTKPVSFISRLRNPNRPKSHNRNRKRHLSTTTKRIRLNFEANTDANPDKERWLPRSGDGLQPSPNRQDVHAAAPTTRFTSARHSKDSS
jgi:hypothetical protein